MEQGRKIYPINQICDNRIDKIYKIENWLEVFYTIKKGKMKDRFIQQMKNSEYSEFFRGLNYEYGINNYKKDLKLAFNIYKKAADNTCDTLAMFRMYHIYKKDFNKFFINKRERILELFYLFKCFSYSRYPIMERRQSLFNLFDIKLEVLILFEEEDDDTEKFQKFIKHLKDNYSVYKIKKSEIDFIKTIINIEIILEDELQINEELIKLSDLISENNPEATYKYICLNKSLEDEYKEKEFKILYDKKYYRSYIDYALFLNSKNRYKEALQVLIEAKNNGILASGFIYFDIFLDNCDFNFLMKNSENFSPNCELYFLLMIIIDEINIDNVYAFFEYFFLLKICFKHYNLNDKINVYFYDYTKEIVIFLMNMTKETSSYLGKKLIKKYYCSDENYKELNLVWGIIHFYGIKNILKRNLDKAFYYIKIAYEISDSDSYKRFSYFYIYRISEIFYQEKKIRKIEPKKDSISNSKKQIFISEKDIKNIREKIFKDFNKNLEGETESMSSSFFYFLSRLYSKKIGNPGDKMMEYVCLKRASELRHDHPGTDSIISFYRKFKSKIMSEKNESEINYILSHSITKLDSEGYGENGDICPICFDKKRNMISFPCKHLFCDECIYKMEKCPICRKLIMVRFKIN